MLNKIKIKENLEKERDVLLGQMRDIGIFDPETNEWDATPEERSSKESDQNDMADRFEDYESRSNMIKVLEARLNSVLDSLKEIEGESFGKCEVCKKNIEMDRMKANPAAKTCKKHLND